MKKLIFLFVLMLAFVVTKAQSPGTFVAFKTDSTTATAVKYLTITNPVAISGNYAIAVLVKPAAGTVAGTATTVGATLQGSFDNSVWLDITTTADSVRKYNATYTPVVYSYADSYYKYYRVKLNGTGTGVTRFVGSGLLIKARRIQ